MLLSMTGFGEARLQNERWSVHVEVRTVNNRHLKLHTRISDPYNALEPDLDRLIRTRILRGTVQLNLRVEKPARPDDYRINRIALESYRDQLQTMLRDQGGSPELAALLALPGVVETTRQATTDPHEDWPALSEVVRSALDRLAESRQEEGRAMADELLSLAEAIRVQLDALAERAPNVVSSYRERLTDRVQALVRDLGVTVEAKDLIREVAIFAERADIAEELTRLRAHLDAFVAAVGDPKSGAGRKLEFIVQEIGRETNTIGSKANDIAISQGVVEMKGLLEKIRELIQNVE